MIQRYTRPEMGRFGQKKTNSTPGWKSKFAHARLGLSSESFQGGCEALREKASFDIDRINEIEQETRHDVIAFTRAVSETVGPERKWVHYGLTSTDVVDTAMGYFLRQANEILDEDIRNFIDILRDQAENTKIQ